MKDKQKTTNVVLADCAPEGIEDFITGFNAGGGKFTICSYISNQARTSKFSNLKRYIKYFTFPFKYFLKRKNYGWIVGWQQFYALIFCYYCSVFHVKKRNTVVALNFTYKDKSGFKGKIYRRFMKRIVKSGYLDYIHVPSNNYAQYFSKEFGFPIEKILVTTFGVTDLYDKYKDSRLPADSGINKFALAIGRSNRDYDWLINAWQGIDLQLVIICDNLNYSDGDRQKNIKVINNVSGKEQYPYFINSVAVILPLKDGRIASGDTVLLTAMSFEKDVIVTKPSTIAEMYINDGINGYVINKSQGELKTVISQIMSGETLGKAARQCYLQNYSQYSMGLALSKNLQAEKVN